MRAPLLLSGKISAYDSGRLALLAVEEINPGLELAVSRPGIDQFADKQAFFAAFNNIEPFKALGGLGQLVEFAIDVTVRNGRECTRPGFTFDVKKFALNFGWSKEASAVFSNLAVKIASTFECSINE